MQIRNLLILIALTAIVTTSCSSEDLGPASNVTSAKNNTVDAQRYAFPVEIPDENDASEIDATSGVPPSTYNPWETNESILVTANGSHQKVTLNYSAGYLLEASEQILNASGDGVLCYSGWRDFTSEVPSLNLSLYRCWGRSRPEIWTSCTFAGCIYFFTYKDGELTLINESGLADQSVPIDTPEKALDLVKAQWMIAHPIISEKRIYSQEDRKQNGCGWFRKVQFTEAIRTDDGFNVTVLRRVTYPCVRPILVEEHYSVTEDGTTTLQSKKEVQYCKGDAVCWD